MPTPGKPQCSYRLSAHSLGGGEVMYPNSALEFPRMQGGGATQEIDILQQLFSRFKALALRKPFNQSDIRQMVDDLFLSRWWFGFPGGIEE